MNNYFFFGFKNLQIKIILLLIFIVIIINNIHCAHSSPKESESIEHEYLRLLFDERLSEEKLQSLAIYLAIFQLHNASGTKLNLLEGKENVPKQSLKKMRKEYVKWTAEMDKNTEIGMNELSKWWEMERHLERMVEMSMLGESFESPRKSISHKCEENCACARQPLNWTDRGNWPDGLDLDLSFKHLQFLDNLFCGTEYNHFLVGEWFLEKKIVGESALAHRMRTAKLGGAVDELRMAKGRMARHLLMPVDLDILETKHPLAMAIDVITDQRLALTFERMFDSSTDSSEFDKVTFRLKSSLSIGKILAHFGEIEYSRTDFDEKLERLWKLFGGILSNATEGFLDNEKSENEVNLAKALADLSCYLEREFGKIGESAKNYTVNFTVTTINSFLVFCLNENNLEKVQKMAQNRQILKEIFQEAGEGIENFEKIFGRFWQWLEEKAAVENTGENDSKKMPIEFVIEQKAKEKKLENAKIIKTYEQCPRAKMGIEETIKMDRMEIVKDLAAYELTIGYSRILTSDDELDEYQPLVSKVEMQAALWYYKESMGKMLRKADSVKEKTEKSWKKLKMLKKLWKKMEENWEEDEGEEEEEEKLCKLYKMAEKLTELCEESEASINCEKLIRLEEFDGINWGKIDCKNHQKTSKLREYLTEGWKMKHIHFVCLDKLIERFIRMKNLFCHGLGEVSAFYVKDNLRILVSVKVLEALEAQHPEILHFEKINVASFDEAFLSQMRLYKSGTKGAQNCEARIYVPMIVNRMNTLEKELENDFKLAPLLRNALLAKIVKAKNEFYALLANESMDNLRQSHCELFKLVTFVEKGIRKGVETAQIGKWKPTECQAEETIAETLLEQRRKKRVIMFKNLKQTLQTEENRTKLNVPGFYTRLARFLEDEAMRKELVKEEQILSAEIFDNDKLLKAYYSNVILSTDPLVIADAWLKADITVFIRWMNRKDYVKGCANEMMAQQIGRIWDRVVQSVFTRTYDSMFDLQKPVIGKPKENSKKLRKIYATVKDYIEHTVKGKKMKTDKTIRKEVLGFLEKKLRIYLSMEIMSNRSETMEEEEADSKTEKEKERKMIKHFDKWIQQKHFETLKGMIGEEDRQFRDKLANGRNNIQEVAKNFVDFFYSSEYAEETLDLLGIQSQHSMPKKEITVTDSPISGGWSPSQNSPMGSSSISTNDSPMGEIAEKGEKKREKRKKTKRSNKGRTFLESPASSPIDGERTDEGLTAERDEDSLMGKEKKGEKKGGKEEGEKEGEKEDEKEDNEEEVNEGDNDNIEEKEEVGEGEKEEESNREEKEEKEEKEYEEEKENENEEKEERKEKEEYEEEKENANEEKEERKEKEEEKEKWKAKDERKEKGEQEEQEEEEEKEEEQEEEEEEEEEEREKGEMSVTKHEEKRNREYNFYLIQNDDIKINDLVDKNVLLTSYTDLLWHFMQNVGKTKRKLENPKLEDDENEIVNSENLQTLNYQTLNDIVRFLDLGIYANEIWQRIKGIYQIEDIWHEIGIEKSKLALIEGKWAQLKEKVVKKGESTKLEQQMHLLLKELLKMMDRQTFLSNEKETAGREIGWMKREMHRRKLALLMDNDNLAYGMFCGTMHKMRTDQTDWTLSQLIDLSSIECPSKEFVYLVRKANLQRKIDAKLYEQYRNNRTFSSFVPQKMSANFVSDQLNDISELWQPFEFGEEFDNSHNKLVSEVIKANKFGIFDDKQREKVGNFMAQMKRIVRNWSSNVIFQFAADFLLRPIGGKESLLSVCIMPNEFDVSRSFLGAAFYCDFGKREKCHDNSLYCELCKLSAVSSLTKVQIDQFNSVPQLHFTFQSVQMTVLAFVVPGLANLRPDESFDGRQIDRILQKFGDEIEKLIREDHLFDEGQFRSSKSINSQTMELLSNALAFAKTNEEMTQIMAQCEMFSQFDEMLTKDRQKALQKREMVKHLVIGMKTFANFGNIFKILEMISDKNDIKIEENGTENRELISKFSGSEMVKRFSVTLAYVETWTKSNYINEQTIGFLDFNLLFVMVAKVFLLYPNATVPTLIEKFFVTYSTWKWSMPIQLAQTDFTRKGEFLSWTPGREHFVKRQFSPRPMLRLIRPVLAMAIITPTFPEQNLAQNANLSTQKCLRNHMTKALAKIRNENNQQKAFFAPLESKTFSTMYEHFIVVTCTASQFQIEQFSDFVGQRIGTELTEIVEDPLKKWIKFCHLFPARISVGQCNGTNSQNSQKNGCNKIWLIGIEMNESPKEMSKFKSKIKANLKKKFDEKISKDFGGYSAQIESEYVDERGRIEQIFGG